MEVQFELAVQAELNRIARESVCLPIFFLLFAA